MTLRDAVSLLADGAELPPESFASAFNEILSGTADDDTIAAFLTGMRPEQLSPMQLGLAASALRDHARPFDAPAAFDCCGTGGDGNHSLNISTATALVVAACGVPVAKHGNRSVSSRSGSADVLESLGARLDAPRQTMQHSLRETHFTFLMAPAYHPAMKHVAPVRRRLGIRTIFNLLGPLSNPARPNSQLLGVYDLALLDPFALALKALGCERAWVVHGHGGFDELTLTGPSECVELRDGELRRFTVVPEDFGLPVQQSGALKGGDAEHNAAALARLLDGEKGPYRDAVLANAAASLIITGATQALLNGVAMAAHAIDTGNARSVLDRFIAISHTRSL